jgi:chaperonin GroES
MLKVLEDRVVIEPIVIQSKTTASGLIIQSNHDEKPSEAYVIAVNEFYTSPNGQQVAIDIKVGDKVLFSKYSGTELKHENKEYLVLQYRDILAKLED